MKLTNVLAVMLAFWVVIAPAQDNDPGAVEPAAGVEQAEAAAPGGPSPHPAHPGPPLEPSPEDLGPHAVMPELPTGNKETGDSGARLRVEITVKAPLEEQPSDKPGAPPVPEIDLKAELAEIRAQLIELRAEVSRLQTVIDVYSGSLLADLKDENERLRRQIRRLPGGYIEALDSGLPVVPMPDGELIERAVRDAENSRALDDAALGEEQGAPVAAGELGYTVVAEWGRTPEEAAEFGPEVTSLKGMICVVPAGAGEKDLIDLGWHLRSECKGFDNINIEVFDDIEAAESYEETNIIPPEHHVMGVSKHRSSGRDILLLFSNGVAQEFPWQELGIE